MSASVTDPSFPEETQRDTDQDGTTRPDSAQPGEAVLEAVDVTVIFDGKSQSGKAIQVTACNSVSLSLARGEIVALVGESGSGKTTLARSLSLHQPINEGEIRLKGAPVKLTGRGRVKARQYYSDVQMIFQDPFASLNNLKTVRHILGRAVKLHSGLTSKKDVEKRTLELLETVHLTPAEDYIDRYPSSMSGGQRQRISIARALAVDPTVILADEPTSMLDVSIRVDILNLLDELRRTKGVAILYITHDIASARYISDRMAVMYKGDLVELGPTEQVVLEPREEYTKKLIAAAPDPNRRTRKTRRRAQHRAADPTSASGPAITGVDRETSSSTNTSDAVLADRAEVQPRRDAADGRLVDPITEHPQQSQETHRE